MNIGYLYFIADSFFENVDDPNLKINYSATKRPHYYAIQDSKTNLYWMVPCSSKVEKFERIIENKKAKGKPTDTVKIVKIFDNKTVLLFQDMFPVAEKYIESSYIKGGQQVRIANPKTIAQLEKNGRKIIHLLQKGIRFTPTQPDILKIEKIMLEEQSHS